jgi:hypothetical protein
MQHLIDFWNLQIHVFPVVVVLLVCEAIAIFRHFKSLAYVPIYFSVFPFRELNRDLSLYLGDDYFTGGDDLSPAQTESLRKRIILTGLISLTVAAVVTPAISGFVAAFVMRSSDFAAPP